LIAATKSVNFFYQACDR